MTTMRYRIHTLHGEYTTSDVTEARQLGFVCDLWGDMGNVVGIPVPSRGREDWQWLLSSGNGGGTNHLFYGPEWQRPDLFSLEGVAQVKPWMELAVSLGLIIPEQLRTSQQVDALRVLRGLPLLDFVNDLPCSKCRTHRTEMLQDRLWCPTCEEYSPARTDYPELNP